jgi:FKBP-type peptidyl-prolyl cis-trans isomerase
MTRNVKWMGLAAVAALAAACGMTETRTTAAKAACEPPPKTLVTKDLKVGDGREARLRTTAIVSYTGWVYDACAPDHKGAQFDSNVEKRVPFGFFIGGGRVIKGWDEGVIGMREGGTRRLIIPPDKAYGEREIAGKIPANSTLVFDVTLAQLTDPNQPPVNSPPPKQ